MTVKGCQPTPYVVEPPETDAWWLICIVFILGLDRVSPYHKKVHSPRVDRAWRGMRWCWRKPWLTSYGNTLQRRPSGKQQPSPMLKPIYLVVLLFPSLCSLPAWLFLLVFPMPHLLSTLVQLSYAWLMRLCSTVCYCSNYISSCLNLDPIGIACDHFLPSQKNFMILYYLWSKVISYIELQA